MPPKSLEPAFPSLIFFEKKGLITIESQEMYRIPEGFGLVKENMELSLNQEQLLAAEQIFREWQEPDPRPALLFGVTGSGKTQVYMRLIQKVLEEGKQAIVLIPEIALTYQTVRRFYAMFGDKVSVLNSRLSQGERYDQFKRAKRGEIQVMVGPRSALFTPFSDLGLIVIDEEHEPPTKVRIRQGTMHVRLPLRGHEWNMPVWSWDQPLRHWKPTVMPVTENIFW